MAGRAAIRSEGQGAEDLFIQLVSGARASDKAKLGDAIVTVDRKDDYVEIKECHAATGKSGTIHQVRAIKYICCVVWAPNRECWYVVAGSMTVQATCESGKRRRASSPPRALPARRDKRAGHPPCSGARGGRQGRGQPDKRAGHPPCSGAPSPYGPEGPWGGGTDEDVAHPSIIESADYPWKEPGTHV